MNLEQRINALPAGSIIMIQRRIFFVVRGDYSDNNLVSISGKLISRWGPGGVRDQRLTRSPRLYILFTPPTTEAREAIVQQRKHFVRELFYKQLLGPEKKTKRRKPKK